MKLFLICALLLGVGVSQATDHIVLKATKDMERADLYAWNNKAEINGVLVLCPGCNGNGEELIKQSVWQEFAATRVYQQLREPGIDSDPISGTAQVP